MPIFQFEVGVEPGTHGIYSRTEEDAVEEIYEMFGEYPMWIAEVYDLDGPV